MPENKPNFLESIQFQEDFPPFKGPTDNTEGTKIEFGGEKEVQRMIEFYLKNKGIENYKKNAERFKINCVLGNNGGGKSRLLNGILYDYVEVNNGNLNYYNILDDFFKLSGNIETSVNYELFSETNYNRFYCNTFNFLNSRKTNKKIFSSFLNFNEDYKFSLNYKINQNWYQDFGGEFLEFIEYEKEGNIYDKNAVNSKINFSESYNFFKFFYDFLNDNTKSNYNNIGNIFSNEDIKNIWLNLSDLFIATINNFGNLDNYNSGREIIFNEHTQMFLEKLDIILFFLNLVEQCKLKKYYTDIGEDNIKKCKIKEKFLKIKSQIHNLKQYFSFLKNGDENNAEKIAQIILGGKKKYGKFSFELQQKLNKDKSSTYSEYFFLDLIYDFHYSDLNSEGFIDTKCIMIFRNLFEMRIKHDIYDNYLIQIDKSVEGGINDFKFSEEEIELLKFPFFNLDINFIDGKIKKSFDNLSAGEKTILTRFTNIHRTFYERIIPQELEKGNTAIILIDEPDLHLHLDWQRQYIQKLIDVFSTLDLEINLHFIIATHSPFIISDLPKESLVLLNKGEQVDNNEIPETFGANYIDIIKNGFFFEDKMLMGSFAQNIIGDIAENERKSFTDDKELDKNHENIKNNIGDDFLKDNLLYFKPEKKGLK